MSILSVLGSADNFLSILVVIITAVVISWKYIQFHVGKEKLDNMKISFNNTVSGLSSNSISEKIASAVLLRRYFDKNSESGVANLAYANDTINVIAGLLKYEQTSDFQKMLGDGLAYAPTLVGKDLQRVNLQNTFLGKFNVNISGADFYGADLSNAIIKKVIAKETVFYEARLQNTKFNDSDLRKANFTGADLDGANFIGARLDGANFQKAINIPPNVNEYLDDEGIYHISNKGKFFSQSSEKVTVFIGKQGSLNITQNRTYTYIEDLLKKEEIIINKLDRVDYQEFGIVAEIKRLIQTSEAVIIFGFIDISIETAKSRADSGDETILDGKVLSSAWIHTELGIAVGSSKKTLLVYENDVNDGIFDDIVKDINITKISTNNLEYNRNELTDWINKIKM